jgi:transcriptional regulator with XRE-family HTH domain
MIDSRDIGRRVAYWRKRRGMSRSRFAALIGRSVSWVEKIEKGERELVRLPVLERVAGALQIGLRVLIDEADAEDARKLPDATEVAAIKMALGRYEMVISREDRHEALGLEGLARQVDYVHEAFLASDFAIVGRALPALIVNGQHAVAMSEGEEQRRAAGLLVMIYKTTSSTFHKFGAHELAWLAADRAIAAAAIAGDPVSMARGARCAARALMSVGQCQQALTLLVDAGTRLEPELAEASSELASLIGMVWLAAEIAAARAGDADTARDMHRNAEAVARRFGLDYVDRSTAFGPTNIALHRLAALVRLGDGAAALDYAATIDQEVIDRLPRERKVNYLLDLAWAHRQCGNNERAVAALWQADQTASQEVRKRPLVRELIAALWESGAELQRSSRLRDLAGHAGLPM